MSGNRYPGQLFLSARPMLYRIALRLPNKRGQLRARLSGLGSTRNGAEAQHATPQDTSRAETHGQNRKSSPPGR